MVKEKQSPPLANWTESITCPSCGATMGVGKDHYYCEGCGDCINKIRDETHV